MQVQSGGDSNEEHTEEKVVVRSVRSEASGPDGGPFDVPGPVQSRPREGGGNGVERGTV